MSSCNRVESKVWQAYRDELFRFIVKRVRDASVAEDLVQKVLLKAHTQQDSLRDSAKLRAWLFQITRHAIIDHFRGQKTAEEIPDDWVGEDAEEDHTALAELSKCLLPLVEELPEPYRHALQLSEFEGITQREVAERQGISLSGAKSRVQRARKMLHDVLLRCCRIEFDRRGGVIDYEARRDCGNCQRV